MEKKTFYKVNEDGTKILCKVICMFDNETTGKSYVVYTTNEITETGSIKAYAGSYIREEMTKTSQPSLNPIETDKEWDMIEDVIKQIQNKD